MVEETPTKLYSRLYKRLQASKQSNEFYETHQLYRILYNRLNDKNEQETENLLQEGALFLLRNNQHESGTDLAVLLIKYYIERKKSVNEEIIIKMKNLYSLMTSESEERRLICLWMDKWLKGDEGQLWHNWVAVVLWGEGSVDSARYHFILSGQGAHTALFLIYLHRLKGYRSEIDLFLVQAVLQFLCLERQGAAVSTFVVYVRHHPELPPGPPFPRHPLLNFVWFLLLAVEARLSSAVFTVLCDRYSRHTARDPVYGEYLGRIGQLYFNVPPPSTGNRDSGSNLLSNIMSMLVGGGGAPGDHEEGAAVGESQFATEEMD